MFFTGDYFLQLIRRKYRHSNLAKSIHFGLIMSRLYSGSWNLIEVLVQDFSFKPKPMSIGYELERRAPVKVNLHTGSSYATHELVRILSFRHERELWSLKPSLSSKPKFKFFPNGPVNNGPVNKPPTTSQSSKVPGV